MCLLCTLCRWAHGPLASWPQFHSHLCVQSNRVQIVRNVVEKAEFWACLCPAYNNPWLPLAPFTSREVPFSALACPAILALPSCPRESCCPGLFLHSNSPAFSHSAHCQQQPGAPCSLLTLADPRSEPEVTSGRASALWPDLALTWHDILRTPHYTLHLIGTW